MPDFITQTMFMCQSLETAYLFDNEEQEEMNLCGWHQLSGPEKLDKSATVPVCPRCGGPVVLVKVAV